MSLFVVGVNHKTAPVEVRERIAFAPERLMSALRSLIELQGVGQTAILSTCNRTEVYCELAQPGACETVIEWLEKASSTPESLRPYLYQHSDQDVARHVFRVACGLDSLVLGEPQILGQLKSAVQTASEAGTLGRQLRGLFEQAFSVAKRVRTETEIGSNPVSVAFAAVALAKQIFGDLGAQTALMIGAGETIALSVRHLSANGIGKIIVANRILARAEAMAAQYDGLAVGLSDLPEVLPRADIVIAATANPVPILGKGAVERALKLRKHKPMFMVDLAVPRDIEPEVGKLNDVFLYTVDDLGEVIADNLRSRHEAAGHAEIIVQTQVEAYIDWLRSQDAVSLIRGYRQRSLRMSERVLEKARGMLAAGKTADEALQYLAHALTQQLIHEPTVALNDAAKKGDRELLDAAVKLLKIEDSML